MTSAPPADEEVEHIDTEATALRSGIRITPGAAEGVSAYAIRPHHQLQCRVAEMHGCLSCRSPDLMPRRRRGSAAPRGDGRCQQSRLDGSDAGISSDGPLTLRMTSDLTTLDPTTEPKLSRTSVTQTRSSGEERRRREPLLIYGAAPQVTNVHVQCHPFSNGNPGFLCHAVQEQLDKLVGTSSGFIESQPKAVRRRIAYLEELQVRFADYVLGHWCLPDMVAQAKLVGPRVFTGCVANAPELNAVSIMQTLLEARGV